MDGLVEAKRRLNATLGDNFKKYLAAMRAWFTGQMAKDDFDHHCRQFLSQDEVHAHNEFLLALFKKCSHLAPPKETNNNVKEKIGEKPKKVSKPAKKKLKMVRANFDHRFEPAYLANNYISSPLKFVDEEKLSKVQYAHKELLLPDHFMAHLRIFVMCWESGLDGVQDNAVQLCNLALRQFMKSILAAIVAMRSSYRLRERKFQHSFNVPTVNPYLLSSSSLLQTGENILPSNEDSSENTFAHKTSKELAESKTMFELACSHTTDFKDDNIINLWHLLHALRLNPSVIPSNQVFSVNVERIICKLNHIEI